MANRNTLRAPRRPPRRLKVRAYERRDNAGRALARGELAALLATCEQTPLGGRDAAILTALYGCGLRREELVSLDLADYDRAAAETTLDDWLVVRGSEPEPLFWGLGNRNTGRRLTAQAVYNMLGKRTKEAGVERVRPDDFRRTYVGDLLDAGADIVTVQKMAALLHVSYARRTLRPEAEADEMSSDYDAVAST